MKREELIWNYLDGNITPENRLKVELLLKTDDAFMEEFANSKMIHRLFSENPLALAPTSMISDVMTRLDQSSLSAGTSGISFTPLLIFLFSLVLLTISSYGFGNISGTGIFQYVENYAPEFIQFFDFDLPSFGKSNAYILLCLIIPPALYIIDQFIMKKRIGRIGLLSI